jgi:dihydrofolate reductase
MGRKTFESIGKALPNRKNIVLSRDVTFNPEGVEVITDPLMAFDIALEFNDSEESELVVIGGAEIYKIYLPYVQKIYLSEVDYHGPADAHFPELDKNQWREIHSETFPQFKFKILERL